MTLIVDKFIGGKRYIEGYYVSTETIPEEDIAMGSNLYCLDENKKYYFKDATDKWIDPTAEG